MNIKVTLLLIAVLFLFPAAIAEGSEDIQADAIIEVGTDTVIDLADSGSPQTVRAQYIGVEDESTLQLVVFGSDGGVNLFDTEISFIESARILDLNGDGKKEILLTGSVFAMDYVSYCLTFTDEEGIRALPFADIDRGGERSGYSDHGYGMITDISNGCVTLGGYQDILGTRFGTRVFKLDDGKMELSDDGLWHFAIESDTWDYGALTVKRPMKVRFDDGKTGTLSAGTLIAITASDLDSIVYFTTADGMSGSFEVEPDTSEGWGSLIRGTREDEWFEYLPYAG